MVVVVVVTVVVEEKGLRKKIMLCKFAHIRLGA